MSQSKPPQLTITRRTPGICYEFMRRNHCSRVNCKFSHVNSDFQSISNGSVVKEVVPGVSCVFEVGMQVKSISLSYHLKVNSPANAQTHGTAISIIRSSKGFKCTIPSSDKQSSKYAFQCDLGHLIKVRNSINRIFPGSASIETPMSSDLGDLSNFDRIDPSLAVKWRRSGHNSQEIYTFVQAQTLLDGVVLTPHPNAQNPTIAFVNSESVEVIENIRKSLQESKWAGSCGLSVDMKFSCAIYIHQMFHQQTENHLKRIQTMFNVSILFKTSKSQKKYIAIKGAVFINVLRTKMHILEFTRGRVWRENPEDSFETQNGINEISELADRLGIIIKCNKATKTITFYSFDDHQNILEHLRSLPHRQAIKQNEKFMLIIDDIEYRKIIKYRIFIEKIIKTSLLLERIEEGKFKLTFASACSNQDKIAKIFSKLDMHDKLSKNECSICFEETTHPVVFPCAHSACTECIEHYVGTAETFPIGCVACAKPLPVDIIMTYDNTVKSPITQRSLKHFIENEKKYIYCQSPDCPYIFECSEDVRNQRCPICLVSMCTICKTLTHHESKCEKNMRVEEERLADWARKHNVKRCPKCNIYIEKNKGCMHMECRCGAHICWICMELFNTGKDVYTHIRTQHGEDRLFETPAQNIEADELLARRIFNEINYPLQNNFQNHLNHEQHRRNVPVLQRNNLQNHLNHEQRRRNIPVPQQNNYLPHLNEHNQRRAAPVRDEGLCIIL